MISFILDAIFDNVLLIPTNLYLASNPLFTFPSVSGTAPSNTDSQTVEMMVHLVPGLHLVDPALVYNKGFITLSFNFAVSPTAR